jgi:hypothetical protein
VVGNQRKWTTLKDNIEMMEVPKQEQGIPLHKSFTLIFILLLD